MFNVSRQDERPVILIIGCGSLGGSLAGNLLPVARLLCCDISSRALRPLQGLTRCIKKIKQCRGETFDLTIIATKCHDLRAVVEDFSRNGRTRAMLFLQNGDFSLHWVSRLMPAAEIYRGVTTAALRAPLIGGAKVLAPGEYYLGAYSRRRSQLPVISGWFRAAGMRTFPVEDYRSALWAKLIFSAVMNPLPILTGTDYRILGRNNKINRLVLAGIGEGKRVAAKMKIPLAFDPYRIVRKVRAGQFGNFRYKGSMYNDFIQGQPLELEYITGEVVRQARRLGLKTPVLDLIYAMTMAMEKGRGGK